MNAASATTVLLLMLGIPFAVQAQQEPPIQAATGRLPDITVSTPRGQVAPFNVPGSVDRVDGNEMREGRLQVNLSESLGAVPGLQVQNRLNYAQDLQLSIRGFGARSTFGVRGVRLYVDGIPATLPDGQGQTSNIDIGSVDRVEILRGPFSALYGNSSGGVLQAFTASGEGAPRLSYSAAGGSFGTWRQSIQLSGSQGAVDYLLGASRFHTDGWREHSAARRDIANGKLGIALDNGDKLTLVLNSVRIDAQDPLGLTADQYALAPRNAPLATQYDTRKTVEQTQVGLLYERRIDATQGLRLMVYGGERKTTQYQSIPPSAQQNPLHAGGVIDLSRQYGGVDARWTAALQLAGRPLDVVAGLAYDSLRERRRGYENYLGSVANPVLGVQGRLRRSERNEVWNLDPYAQATWRFTDRWTLEAGVRRSSVHFASNDRYIVGANRDDSGTARYGKTLPVASLRYQATPDLALYGFHRPRVRDADAQRALVPLGRRERPQFRAAAVGQRQRRTGRQGAARRRAADGSAVPDPHARRDRDRHQRRRPRHLPERGAYAAQRLRAGLAARDGEPLAHATGLHLARCDVPRCLLLAVALRRGQHGGRRQPHSGHRAAVAVRVAGLGAARGLARRRRDACARAHPGE
jgi:iron complex outermembrane receptor protein